MADVSTTDLLNSNGGLQAKQSEEIKYQAQRPIEERADIFCLDTRIHKKAQTKEKWTINHVQECVSVTEESAEFRLALADDCPGRLGTDVYKLSTVKRNHSEGCVYWWMLRYGTKDFTNF